MEFLLTADLILTDLLSSIPTFQIPVLLLLFIVVDKFSLFNPCKRLNTPTIRFQFKVIVSAPSSFYGSLLLEYQVHFESLLMV